MNLNIPFTTEQVAALESLAAECGMTADEYATKVILGVVNARVDALFDASVKALADAAAPLSYEKRTELIAQVQTTIANA